MIDKKHWYDGLIYDKFVAPNQDLMFRLIRNMIDKDSSVIDVGCGTGRLEFQLADKCKSVTGIDLSSKNIKVANKNLENKKLNNVTFLHTGIEELAASNNTKYDYAVMTFVIHEIAPVQRLSVLASMKKIANTIIIGDYLVPRNNSFSTKFSIAVEYFAGKDHYTNYKSFVKQGGINYLIKEAGLKTLKEIKGKPEIAQIVKAV